MYTARAGLSTPRLTPLVPAKQVVVQDERANGEVRASSDLSCFLFDLAGTSAGERVELVAVLVAALGRPGLTAVVNTHEMAALLERKLGIRFADIFDSQVRVPTTIPSEIAPLTCKITHF